MRTPSRGGGGGASPYLHAVVFSIPKARRACPACDVVTRAGTSPLPPQFSPAKILQETLKLLLQEAHAYCLGNDCFNHPKARAFLGEQRKRPGLRAVVQTTPRKSIHATPFLRGILHVSSWAASSPKLRV